MKKILLVSITLVSLGFSLCTCKWIAEKFFFDRVFYKRSAEYGYSQKSPIEDTIHNSPYLAYRVRDLVQLLEKAQHTSTVLGVQSSDTDTFQIVLIGDSMTYGVGAKTDETFGKLLENKLSIIRPTKVSILALPGDDFIDNYYKLQLAEEEIQPDLYIFTFVSNDLAFNYPSKYSGADETRLSLKEGCPQPDFHPDWEVPMDTWQELVERMTYPSFSPEFSGLCILHNGISRLPMHKILFMTLESAWVGPSADTAAWHHYHIMETYTSAVKSYGGSILDVRNMPDFTYEAVSQREHHPSANVHLKYASYLFDEINRRSKWGFMTAQ